MLTAIIVAAGSSRRMGFDKLFADLGGKPVVAHSIAAFEACADVRSITVVTLPERNALLEELARTEAWTGFHHIVPGGAERHLSVWNGLATINASGAGEFVAVHDGARPLVTPAMITRCLERARAIGAASCAAPVSDTLKRADPAGCIAGSLERAGVWAMQTPQIFALDALRHAYQAVINSGAVITDETSALQSVGLPVALVNSEGHNLKITYPQDLALAASILQSRRLSET